MQDRGLPTYPTKGSRRKLDEAWLGLLYRDGIAGFFPDMPPPPPKLGQAIQEFNQGQFWQCHETLEGIWLLEQYPLRLFYHGLIKAAVGLLHLERRNRYGAAAKLSDAEYTLAPFLPAFMGIEVRGLYEDIKNRRDNVKADLSVYCEAIEELPPVQIRRQEAPYSQPGG